MWKDVKRAFPDPNCPACQEAIEVAGILPTHCDFCSAEDVGLSPTITPRSAENWQEENGNDSMNRMIEIPLDGIVDKKLRLTTDAFMKLVNQTGVKPRYSTNGIIYTYFVDIADRARTSGLLGDRHIYTLTEKKLPF